MSSHIHLALVAGLDRFDRWAGPLDRWLALSLNRRQNRHGPVIQERPTTIYMEPHSATRLIPYIHNNPVRAGCTGRRGDPAWTSHRAYLGREAAPPGLAVDVGLELCGCSTDQWDRETFARLVEARASDERDDDLSASNAPRCRREARFDVGAPVELTSPFLTSDGLELGVVQNSTPARPLGLALPPEDVVHAACLLGDLAVEEVLGRSRRRDVVAVRRLAARVWRGLGRPLVEMSRVLGISSSAISRLVDRCSSPSQEQDDLRVEVLLDVLTSDARPAEELVGAGPARGRRGRPVMRTRRAPALRDVCIH